jgi:membrane protease YdiL (CAAX protease family)
METKLTGKDRLLLVACALISGGSVLLLNRYYRQAFPEASIEFKVNRDQSKKVAEDFLAVIYPTIETEQGAGGKSPVTSIQHPATSSVTAGYRHAQIFDYDNLAKVFLEREYGLAEANPIMGRQVKLWRWEHRWFKPLQKEEFRVKVAPDGGINGFSHLVPEEDPGANLSVDSARTIALAFLQDQLSKDPATLEFVEVQTQKRPNRTDHTFTWKVAGVDYHEATYRYEVGMQGDRVDLFREYLKVPDTWQRNYEKLRSRNETTSVIAAFFLILTILAMIYVFIQRIRRHDVRWRTAGLFSLIAFVLVFCASLNSLPLQEFGYDTEDTYSSFLFRAVLSMILQASAAGVAIFLFTAAAEPLYREHYRNKISLTHLFSWRSIRTKRFFIGVILGITLAFAFAAYQTVFYLMAGKIGAWSPQQIPYTELLNTSLPWIFILLFGFFPAVSEEFMSRMFSIPFLEKYARARWLAVLIPAIIWGFGHANYPQQPFYIRGLEVGLAGIFLGIIMLRFDILVTLIWHYTIDAVYTGFLLFRSGNTYMILSAAIAGGIMLIPLIVAFVAYLLKGRFESPEELTNEKEGTAPELPPAQERETLLAYVPAEPRWRWRLLLMALILAGAFLLPGERFGTFVDAKHNIGEAENAAAEILRGMGIATDEFRRARIVSASINPTEAKYILLNSNMHRLNQLYSTETPEMSYGVRFFRALSKEEYKVFLDPRDLRLVSFQRTVEDDAPGDSLEQTMALEKARAFLNNQGVDVTSFVLQESKVEDRKARRDYHLVWEAPEGDRRNLAEAKYRVTVDLQGSQIAGFSRFFKIPENWEREREKRTLVYALHIGLRIVVIGLFIVFALWQFIRFARQGAIPWRRVIWLALLLAAIQLINPINQFSAIAWQYPTAIEYQLFLLSTIFGLLVFFAMQLVMYSLIIGLMFGFMPEVQTLLKPRLAGQPLARDAFWATVITLLGLAGLRRLNALAESWWPALAIVNDLPGLDRLDAFVPGLGYFFEALGDAFLTAALVGVFLILLTRQIGQRWLQVLVLVAGIFAFTPTSERSIGELAFHLVQLSLPVIWLILCFYSLFKKNVLAYMSAAFCMTLLFGGIALVSLSSGYFRWQGVALLLVAGVWLVGLWLYGHRTANTAAA